MLALAVVAEAEILKPDEEGRTEELEGRNAHALEGSINLSNMLEIH